ncbi:Glycogen synthase [Microbacterium oleivorans]|nr:Glycogen synthase [Microbacterium oleivorans]
MTSETLRSSPSPDILIVAPWLQGGGGQGALAGILRELPRERLRLLVLFNDNRKTDSVTDLVEESIFLNLPRNPLGVIRAARQIHPYLRQASSIYSLMRGSHLVLGLLPRHRLRRTRFAATFHQLPSQDSSSARGRIEDHLVRRATRSAGLVTAPSPRAVDEIVSFRFAAEGTAKFEPNSISLQPAVNPTPRKGKLASVRLLLAGRLSAQKGIDRIPELLRSCPTPVTIRIAGEGEHEEAIAEWARQDFLPHLVEYVGHVNDLTEQLDWCDAAFLPSRWELNPLVVWEAWSRGRPVLSSSLPVFEDLKKSGPVLTFGSGDQFASWIDDLQSELLRLQLTDAATAATVSARSERHYIADFLRG